MTDSHIKVGAAQFGSVIGDVDANLATHLDWIARGREAGLDWLVMPEVSLSGHYGTDHLLDCVLRYNDPRFGKLARAAGDMTVTFGFMEEGPAAQFYNSAMTLRGGQIIDIHRKVNLATYGLLEDGKYFSHGDRVDLVRFDDDWRAGVLICADMWNPALAHISFSQGATLMISPISSGVEAVGGTFDNPAGWRLASQFYATVYGAPVVLANRTGVEKNLSFWGGSRIVDPFGRVLAEAGTEPELITATLDFADVRRARFQLPTVRDSNLNLVHRELGRLRGAKNNRVDYGLYSDYAVGPNPDPTAGPNPPVIAVSPDEAAS